MRFPEAESDFLFCFIWRNNGLFYGLENGEKHKWEFLGVLKLYNDLTRLFSKKFPSKL